MLRYLSALFAMCAAVVASADFYPTLWYRPVLPKDGKTVSVSADGTRIVTDGTYVHAMNPSLTGLSAYTRASDPLSAKVSPNGQVMAVTSIGTYKGTRIIRVSDGAELFQLTGPTTSVTSLAISPNGNWLAGAEPGQSRIHFWHIPTGTYIQDIFVNQARTVNFVDNDKVLVTNQSDTVTMVSNNSGSHVRTYTYPGKAITALNVAAKGLKFAVGGPNANTVTVTDVATGANQPITLDPSVALALTPDGKRVAVGSLSLLTLYDAATGIQIWRSSVPSAKSLEFSLDGCSIYALGAQSVANKLTVCDAFRGRGVTWTGEYLSNTLSSMSGNGDFCSFMNNGVFRTESGLLAGAGRGGSISPDGKLFHFFYSSEMRRTFDGSRLWYGTQFRDVGLSHYSPDSQLIAVGVGPETQPKDLHVFNSQTGTIFKTIPNTYIAQGRFTSDGSHFAISGPRPRLFRTIDWAQMWEKVETSSTLAFSEDLSKVLLEVSNAVVARRMIDGNEIGRVSVPGVRTFAIGADSEVVLAPFNDQIRCYRFSDGVLLRSLTITGFPVSVQTVVRQNDSTKYLFVTTESACSVIVNPYFMAGNTPATSLTMEDGVVESGDVSKLLKSDGQVAVLGKGSGSQITAVVKGLAPLGQTVVMRMVGKSESDKVTAKVELFDYSTGQYTDAKHVALGPSGFSRATLVPVNATRFRDVLTGEIKARLTFTGIDPLVPDWKVSVDQACWQVSP